MHFAINELKEGSANQSIVIKIERKQNKCHALHNSKTSFLIGNCWLFKLPLFFFFIFFPSLSFPSFIPYSLLLLFIFSQVFSARVPPTPTIIVTSCAPFYHSSSFVLSLGPFSSIKALTLFIGAQHHHKLPFRLLNNFDEVSFQNRLKPTDRSYSRAVGFIDTPKINDHQLIKIDESTLTDQCSLDSHKNTQFTKGISLLTFWFGTLDLKNLGANKTPLMHTKIHSSRMQYRATLLE